VLLVVDQFIDLGPHHQESEAAGAEAHLFANLEVLDWVFVRDRGVSQIVEPESLAGVGNAVDQHAVRAHT
jgi:hypothetical protein